MKTVPNAVANNAYIHRLKLAIENSHRCTAVHAASAPVHEVFNGKTVWKGEVEVFKLEKHPRARRCFAWSHREGENERVITVLEIPPVRSPETAVRAHVVKDVKDSYSG